MTPRRSVTIAALVAALALAGCGGGAQAKAPAEEPLPPTTEGTLAALERAEADLRLALGEPPPPGAQLSMQPSATSAPMSPALSPPPPAPPPDMQPRAVQADSGEPPSGGAERSSAPDPCSNACRALTSMTRATEHLCNLSGSADARCESARTRVKSAGERVRAHCPSCTAG